MIRRRVVFGLAGVSVIAGVARADLPAAPHEDAPDSAAVEAADANLESTVRRRGLTFTLAFGGGLMAGFGIEGSVGRGGSVSMRLGQVATPRLVLTLETNTTAVLHRLPASREIQPNTSTTVLLGGQYYANPSLWMRGAAGLGVYQGRDVGMTDGTLGDVELIGGAVLGGFGVDLARWRFLVLGLEIATAATVNRDGVLVTSAFNLGLAVD
jgi:hypothetical protein